MINGLDIYYSKNIGRGLKPVSKQQTISQKAKGLKPISTKGRGCKKNWTRTKNITINLLS